MEILRHLLFGCILLLVGSLGCHAQPASNRYLYVVTCDGRVDKLDTVLDQKVNSYDLSRQTGGQHLVPIIHGTPDGCIANGLVYVRATSTFYTAVPEEAESTPTGTHNYRVLGFSVPDLQLVETLPSGKALSDPPSFTISADNSIQIKEHDGEVPPTEADLSAFNPDKQQIPNEILESSGGRTLVRLFTHDSNALVIAVADEISKKLIKLQELPPTGALQIHLAPGGAQVLVEEMASTGSSLIKTGTLFTYNANTGVRVKRLTHPKVKSLFFLAISPSGKAIYHSATSYFLINLEEKFPPDEVLRPVSHDLPGLFFADR